MKTTDPRPEQCVELAAARLRTWVGLDLTRGGVMRGIERHVASRLAALGNPMPQRFAMLLDSPETDERRRLIEAATVPHSWLWRDRAQLAALATCLGRQPRGALDVWVPGCASGEDAYSIAALALSLGRSPTVIGTDVHQAALERARLGRYGAWSCRELPEAMRPFLPVDAAGGAVASAALRACVSFGAHSLLDAPLAAPSSDGWDLIVCRNVLIYFDAASARSIVERLTSALAPGGLLVLGSCDVLTELLPGLAPAETAGRLVLVREDPAQRPERVVRAAPAIVAAPIPPRKSVRPPQPSIVRAAQPHLAWAPSELAGLDVAAALESARARIREDSGDVEAQLEAGLLLHTQGDYDASIACLRAAACLAPGAWAAWLYLAFGLERLGHWTDARRAFLQVGRARGPGHDLPRGTGEFARALHSAHVELLNLAEHRAKSLAREMRVPR